MFKKLGVSLLAMFIACSLAHSGYRFGQYLADRQDGDARATACVPAEGDGQA